MRNAQVVTKMMLHAQFPEDVEVDRTEVPKNSARINFWDATDSAVFTAKRPVGLTKSIRTNSMKQLKSSDQNYIERNQLAVNE